MADYQSALTGTQMDQALLDMAEHNSEAYAVGERNGIAVASDDVTYHNNARYYAQIASSQIVGDASSAVRWDTDQSEVLTDAQKAQARENINAASDSDVVKITAQTLTTAQQEQAKANIMAGGTNPNLLDNCYFVGGGSQLGDGVFPINQRGQTQYTAAGFVFDRWFKSGGVTATLDAGGLTIANSNGWPDGVNQRFPMHFFAQMNGEAITASVLYADGSVDSGTAIIDATQNYQWLKYPEAGEIGFQLKNFQDGAPYDYFDYINFGASPNSTPKKIKAFKLEKGTVSTLANDPVPDYWQELEKCLHYLWITSFPSGSILSTGYASGDFFITDIILPTTIGGSNLTLTFNANALIIGNGTAVVAASVIGVTRHGNHLRTYINPASALTNQNLYAFVTSADTVMVVSAEL